MKGALLKDYYNTNGLLLLFPFYILFIIIAVGYGFEQGGMNDLSRHVMMCQPMISFFISISILLTALRADEVCGWINNGFSQPMTRREYMKEKYIFALLTAAVTGGIAFLGDIITLLLLKGFTTDVIISVGGSLLYFILGFCAVSVWIIVFGICCNLQKLSYIMYIFCGIFILYFVFCISMSPDQRTEQIIRYSVMETIFVLSIIVFISGWKLIEKKDL
ncbi:MAG: ABC-2 transporter permease [Ruminococcus flavefaciens]